MLSNFLVTQSGGTDTVTTTMILDGTIANADVASDAAIDVSKISLDDAVVFNDSGADKDFRVESDGKTHMLFVDGGNNRVGIGTDSPSQTFEVFNNTADATITKFSGADGNMSYVGGARLEFSRDGGCYIAAPGGASASMIFQAGDGLHTRMKLGNDGRVIIGDGGAEDTAVVFDGNAVDFRIGLDDGTDTLEIGGGSAHGTAAGISMDVNGDMTLGGGIACADEVIGRPRFTDYAETKQAMAANSVDLTLGNVQTYTLSGNQTLTFDNPSDTGNACSFTLVVTNGGSATLTWPGAVDWAGGSAPSLTSSGVDILTFTTMDAGTIWYGFAAGLDMG